MKKKISFLLAAALIILSIPFTAFASADEGNSVAYKATVSEEGTNVQVTVELEANIADTLSQGNFTVKYDTSLLTYGNFTEGEMGAPSVMNTGGQITISYAPSKSGTVVVLTFTKSGTGEGSDYGIDIIQTSLDFGGGFVISTPWFYDMSNKDPGITPSISINYGSNSGGIQTASYDVVWNYGGAVRNADADDQYTIIPNDGYAIDEIWVDGELYEGNYHNKATSYVYGGEAPERSLVVFFAYTLDF